jgi:hypothetical protein
MMLLREKTDTVAEKQANENKNGDGIKNNNHCLFPIFETHQSKDS